MVSLIEKVSHLLAIMFSLRNTIFADMARQVTTNLYAALLEELRGSHLHIAATNVRTYVSLRSKNSAGSQCIISFSLYF